MTARILLIALILIASPTWAVDWLNAAKEISSATSSPPSKTLTNTAIAAASSGLSGLISQELGVNEQQATGGLGSLFSLAQTTLSNNDFSSLSSYIPDMDSYLDAVPQTATSGTGGLLKSLGSLGETAGASTQVAQQFSALGLSAAHIPQYVQIVNDFLQSNGGQQAVSLFQQGIASLL